MCRCVVVLILVIGVCVEGFSQQASIQRMEVSGKNLNIYYDLTGDDVNNSYVIKLLSSRDNFATPLKTTSGNVNMPEYNGVGKKIVLNLIETFGSDFEEDVSFQIQSTLYVSDVTFNDITSNVRRGKTYSMQWTGNLADHPVKVELMKNGVVALDLPALTPSGDYALKLPSNQQLGGPYRIRVSDEQNPGRELFTREFTIRHRIPRWLGVIPVAALAFILTRPAPPGPVSLPDPLNP